MKRSLFYLKYITFGLFFLASIMVYMQFLFISFIFDIINFRIACCVMFNLIHRIFGCFSQCISASSTFCQSWSSFSGHTCARIQTRFDEKQSLFIFIFIICFVWHFRSKSILTIISVDVERMQKWNLLFYEHFDVAVSTIPKPNICNI